MDTLQCCKPCSLHASNAAVKEVKENDFVNKTIGLKSV